MSFPMNWCLAGHHIDGSVLTDEEIESLVGILSDELFSEIAHDCGDETFAWFDTEGWSDEQSVRRICAQYTVSHQNVILEVMFRNDTQWWPDKTEYRNGLNTEYTAAGTFTKDNMACEYEEACPHCDTVVAVNFDTNCGHLQTTCPNCGKVMMLCSVCPCRDNIGECNWTKENGCKYRKKEGQDT